MPPDPSGLLRHKVPLRGCVSEGRYGTLLSDNHWKQLWTVRVTFIVLLSLYDCTHASLHVRTHASKPACMRSCKHACMYSCRHECMHSIHLFCFCLNLGFLNGQASFHTRTQVQRAHLDNDHQSERHSRGIVV